MNLKKCTAFFLALLVLTSNISLALNVHYCGGKIASITVQSQVDSQYKEKGCCEKLASAEKSCCKDTVIKLDKKSESDSAKIVASFENFHFTLLEFYSIGFPFRDVLSHQSRQLYVFDANAPPLFLLHSQFIFYA